MDCHNIFCITFALDIHSPLEKMALLVNVTQQILSFSNVFMPFIKRL